MGKYRKKPVVIEAVYWDGNRTSEVTDWIGKGLENNTIIRIGDDVIITTLEGQMKASPGDYIIKGVNGEIYPCKPDIFEKTYDVVNEKIADQESKRSAFIEAATPLVKYIAENWHPHATVIATSTGAELLEGSECFETDKYIVD